MRTVGAPTLALYCAELPEREAALRHHLAERHVSATFFRSVHGRTWGLHTSLEYDKGKHLPPGHVGLNIGTWFAWQHLWLRNDHDTQAYILFEDDVRLPEDYHQQLEKLEQELVQFPDWDLVYLGLAENEPGVWHKVTDRVGGPSSRLCRLDCPFGTHAYMVRRRALPILMANMAKAQRNLDQQLWEQVLSRNLIRWCAVLPGIVQQRTYDHESTGKPEWAPSTIHQDDRPEERQQEKAVTEWQPHEVVVKSSLMVDPFPCIFRGESLVEDGVSSTKKLIPLSQCARLNEPCHSKPSLAGVGRVETQEGKEARWCGCCNLRLQMADTAARSRLPLPEGHFNPSLIWFGGRLVLATRDSWGHSRVALWELTNKYGDWTGEWSCKPLASLGSDHPQAPRLEDPRLFTMPDPDNGSLRLCSMFNLPDGYPPKRVAVGYVRFLSDLTGIDRTEVFPSPNKCLYEKNWTPFWCDADQDLHWVYSTKPEHTILGRASYTTPNRLPWLAGVVRGGAAPVLVEATDRTWHRNDVYYHFFHGCLKRVQGSVYTVGCSVFSAHPPFNVLKQTMLPLIWPDLPAVGEDVVKRYVIWPGGAVPHAGAWHLALGVDDTFCRIVRIPFQDLEAALTDQEETEPTVSLRDTPIARGVTGV